MLKRWIQAKASQLQTEEYTKWLCAWNGCLSWSFTLVLAVLLNSYPSPWLQGNYVVDFNELSNAAFFLLGTENTHVNCLSLRAGEMAAVSLCYRDTMGEWRKRDEPSGNKEISRFLGLANFLREKKNQEYYLVCHLSSKNLLRWKECQAEVRYPWKRRNLATVVESTGRQWHVGQQCDT